MHVVCDMIASSDLPGQVALDPDIDAGDTLEATVCSHGNMVGQEATAKAALFFLDRHQLLTCGPNSIRLPESRRRSASADNGKNGGSPRKKPDGTWETKDEVKARRAAEQARKDEAFRAQQTMKLDITDPQAQPVRDEELRDDVRASLSVVGGDNLATTKQQPGSATWVEPSQVPVPGSGQVADQVPSHADAVVVVVKDSKNSEQTTTTTEALAAARVPEPAAEPGPEPRTQPGTEPASSAAELDRLVALASDRFGWAPKQRKDATAEFTRVFVVATPARLEAEIMAQTGINGPGWFTRGNLRKRYGELPASVGSKPAAEPAAAPRSLTLDPEVEANPQWRSLNYNDRSWLSKAIVALRDNDLVQRARMLNLVWGQSRQGSTSRYPDGLVWGMLTERYPDAAMHRDWEPLRQKAAS